MKTVGDERRLAAALRAQAVLGRPRSAGSRPPLAVGWILVIALLVGAVGGAGLAVATLLVPGLTP